MIYANIATIPERNDKIYKVIASIINQVDELHIQLNNYPYDLKYGSFDDSPYIAYLNTKNRDNDGFWKNKIFYQSRNNQMGDGEKFLKVSEQDGYIFTIDDDLIYPPDYVQTMIDHIERYKRKAIITLHGRTFRRIPIKSYFYGKLAGYHWDVNQLEDIEVHAGGTGVMAWHSDTIKVKYEDIKKANCGDIWMSVFARRAKVPIMCVAHKQHWLKYIGPPENPLEPQTIYSRTINDIELNKELTKIFNDGCEHNNTV